jgi:hypothetical protein
MPVFHLGDLVKPNPASWGQEDILDALGIILEMSSRYRPEAKILWNDMQLPNWAHLSDIVLAEEIP